MLRELALRIALLTPEDRRWLLDQLSGIDQKRITSLIDEAIEMGLTMDPQVLSSLSSARAEKHPKGLAFEKAELVELPLFWQNLIQAHQDDESQKKNLPQALMNSVMSHARQSLSDDIHFSGER